MSQQVFDPEPRRQRPEGQPPAPVAPNPQQQAPYQGQPSAPGATAYGSPVRYATPQQPPPQHQQPPAQYGQAPHQQYAAPPVQQYQPPPAQQYPPQYQAPAAPQYPPQYAAPYQPVPQQQYQAPQAPQYQAPPAPGHGQRYATPPGQPFAAPNYGAQAYAGQAPTRPGVASVNRPVTAAEGSSDIRFVRRKRKAWRWILGTVLGLAVLGAGAYALYTFVLTAATDAANPDYLGAPVDADKAAAGETVTETGNVAFTLPAGYEDVTEQFAVMMPALPTDPAITYQKVSAYMKGPDASGVASIVVFTELTGPLVLPGDLESFHEAYLDGAGTSGFTPAGDAATITTAEGLTAMKSTGTMTSGGVPLAVEVYSFARGHTMLMVMVMASVDGELDGPLIADSIRIDS